MSERADPVKITTVYSVSFSIVIHVSENDLALHYVVHCSSSGLYYRLHVLHNLSGLAFNVLRCLLLFGLVGPWPETKINPSRFGSM